MNAADKRTGQIKDVLYLAGVRADENVHIDAHPDREGGQVVIVVYPNHWRCADCRGRGLVQKMLSVFTKDSDDYCPGCRAQDETNSFHARAKVTDIVKALGPDYTVLDQNAYSSTGHVYVKA